MTLLTDALWETYVHHRDDRTRSQLLAQYLGLVHHSAHEMVKRVPKDLELDDLISAGTVGLVQALESYEPSRGLAFSTFAVPRIRGAMLDELRTWDWIPRSVRERGRRVEQTSRQLQKSLGRLPDSSEMAEALGVDEATYRRWVEDARAPVLMPLDSTTRAEGGGEVRLSEILSDPESPPPGEGLVQEETMMQLREAFGELPAKERLVLSLYYYQGLNLRQIGVVLHITESRVSQLHARAVRRLKDRFREIGGES